MSTAAATGQPSSVHAIGSSRTCLPRVRKPCSYPCETIHQASAGARRIVACPRDHQRSAASCVRAIGLCGLFSHGPCTERDRATITMCPVGGPAVPPTALTR